ncbi:helicase-associated domain-containing protein [Paenibacillus xylaniclasticus]|uniref:helicase-associated domain-containing protein n=1 Tax=Paenibacillus xylaniclasticus TaxID=588083 RepID=UPI000FD7D228|nr:MULTISPECIES: helicase-associated domain-containing protein [Paenibacillus]GFN32006.1 hypothetical protein PCURB6_22660 [Paenibacillus curdlanolyticus]
MRLREVLDRLPSGMAERLQSTVVWKPSAEAWPQAALQPAELALTMSRISQWGRKLLKHWIRVIGPLPIQEEALIARSIEEVGLAGAEMRAAVQELCACGIVFAVRKCWGERILFMPEDCYLAWRLSIDEGDLWAELTRTLTGPITRNSIVKGQVSVGIEESASVIHQPNTVTVVPLARRLTRALAALDRLGLTLTAKGWFPKKTVDTVTRLVALPTSGLVARLRPVHEHIYPVPFAMALDIAFKLGLLHIQDGIYNWSVSARNDWLSGDERVREAELVQLVTMLYGCRSSQEAFFAAGLLKLDPNCTYRAQAESEPHLLLLDWIAFLQACGWVHYDDCMDGGFTFRWLIDPLADRSANSKGLDAVESVIVLPDGDLIVPPYAGLDVRWKLEQIAQLVREDVVAIYRITSESVASAVQHGIDSEELLRSVQAAAGGVELPIELVHAIKHWAAGACRTSIDEVTLLRCDSKEIADAIAVRSELQEWLVERLGDHTFLVRSEGASRLCKELERAGWPPLQHGRGSWYKSEENTAAESVISGKKRIAAQRFQPGQLPSSFIYNEQALDRLELLPPVMDSEDVAGDNIPSGWPAAWTRQLRSYHPSIRKQMIEEALAWGVPVQLITGGQSIELIPQRLNEGTKSWQVSGYIRRENANAIEPVCLTPEMWEEMRIVIPSPTPYDRGL